jgi:hypothetical protein
MSTGVAKSIVGMLAVYCLDSRDVMAWWSVLCTVLWEFFWTRIVPTWAVVVGTGVARFLVFHQKTRATSQEPRVQVAIGQVHIVLVCYFAMIFLRCPHGPLLMCNSCLPNSIPESYLL